MSKNSDGSTVAATATDVVTTAIGTDGLIVPVTAQLSGFLVSESDGDIDLAIEIADNKLAYLVLVMPDGRLIISDVMSYTA